jgi:hypothetical protein
MTIADALHQRWKASYDKLPIASAARPQLQRVLDAAETVRAKRAELAADSNLSDRGRATKLMEFAATAAPRIAKAKRVLETARETVERSRLALVPTVKDKNNVADAMLRAEIRAVLRTKAPGEIAAVLLNPNAGTDLILAVLEAPTLLVPIIAPEVRDRMVDAIVRRVAGPQVAALDETKEALDVLDAAVRSSLSTLQEAAAVSPHTFDAWMEKNAPAKDAHEVSAEIEKFTVAVVEASAKALPLSARIDLGGRLLELNTAELIAA